MTSSKEKKPWYKSRTYWFNIFAGFIALLAMPEFAAVLPEEWLKWIALSNVVGNMLVRNITAGGISAT